MFDKFEVLMSWKLSWGPSFLLLGVSEIKGVKSLAWKSGGVKFLTNLMSALPQIKELNSDSPSQ